MAISARFAGVFSEFIERAGLLLRPLAHSPRDRMPLLARAKPGSVGLLVLVLGASLLPTALAQFVQQGGKLVGAGALGDAFQGGSVGISGDGNTVIVGGQEDNGSTGAAWLYTRAGGVWTQEPGKLVGTGAVRGTVSGASQGASVALSGDGKTAILGGPFDNGDVGAAWVFTRTGGAWFQQGTKLTGRDVVGAARLGISVALSEDGNTAVVGGLADNGGPGAGVGAAWVFTRSGGVWNQQGAKLVGAGAVGGALQGCSVAISGDGNTVIFGGFQDNAGAGAAWVFTRTGGVWSQQGGKLVGTGAAGAYSFQGASVAISRDGSTAMIGGPSDNGGVGAAWVFTRTGGVWSRQGEKLVGTGASGLAFQGTSVALSADGNTAIVGGPEDNPAPGYTGAVWAYTRAGGTWTQQGGKLVGLGSLGLTEQGRSVALSNDGKTAVTGGPYDNQITGAAWVFVAASTGQPGAVITGVVSAAGFTAGGPISSGSWVAIFGTGLAPAGVSRKWNEATDIVNGQLPLSLEGTSVTVDGRPAVVEFLQPSQLNIQVPDDTALGPVQVAVRTSAGISDPFTVNCAAFGPGLFATSAPYVVAQHGDYSNVTATAPARPGEVITLWGTGFGPAKPIVPAGHVFSGANPLANEVTVTIGGQNAPVAFAGMAGAGLVQLNVRVPPGINDGDAPVVAAVGSVSTQTIANLIPVHR